MAMASCACLMASLAASSTFCAPAAIALPMLLPAASPDDFTELITLSSSPPRPSISDLAAAVAEAAHISIALLALTMAACASVMPALPTAMAMSAAVIRAVLRPFTALESLWVWTASSAAAFTASNASFACWMALRAISVTCEAASCALVSASRATSCAAFAASCAASPTLAVAWAT